LEQESPDGQPFIPVPWDSLSSYEREDLPFYIRCLNDEIKVDVDRVDFSKSLFATVREVLSDVEKQIILKALSGGPVS